MLSFDDCDEVSAISLLLWQGQDVGHTDFNRRLLCIEKEIVGPRNAKMQQGLLDRASQPFSVRAKPFWDISTVPKVSHAMFLSNTHLCS